MQEELDQLFNVRIDCVSGNREDFPWFAVLSLLFARQVKPWKVLSLSLGSRVGMVWSLSRCVPVQLFESVVFEKVVQVLVLLVDPLLQILV